MKTKKLKSRVEERVNTLDNYQNIIDDLAEKVGVVRAFGTIFDLDSEVEKISVKFESKEINVLEFLDLAIHSHKTAIKKLNRLD